MPLSPDFSYSFASMNTRTKSSIFFLNLLVCLIIIGCSTIFGQYRYDTWTTDNGLPQNGIRAITQTPDGYLWFTTFDGLVRFDGVRFTTFGKGNTKGIINNRFTGLYCDKDGTLYAITTEDGVLTIYRNGVFTSYNSQQVPGHRIYTIKPDENGELRFLVEDESRSSRSWYYLREGKFVFSETQNLSTLKLEHRGKTGTLWTIKQNEVTVLRNGVTTVYPHKSKIFDGENKAFEDSHGGLWLTGLELVRLKDGKIEYIDKKGTLPKLSAFHSYWEESDGSIWFANGSIAGPGVGIVRYKDGKFTIYGKEAGLSDTYITAFFRDREGTIWLGTGKGLNRFRRKVITAYSVQDGLSNTEVYPLYRDSKDNIWVGSVRGLNVYRNGKFEIPKAKGNYKTNLDYINWNNASVSVQSLCEDSNGAIWIGANGGLFIERDGVTKHIEDGEGYHIFAIKQLKDGNVWLATNKGILLFKDYKLVRTYSVKDGLPNEFMTLVYEDSKGRLWFGGFGGLSEFKDGKFINYTTKQGLAGSYVRSIYEDADGVFWIGTYDEGLSRFKDGRFVNYKAENGLYNNGVFAIEEDRRGNFWISSNHGIYRVRKQELNDFADGKIDKINSVGYGKQDGMLNNECNGGRQPASIKDKDGKFWFPTQDGVVVIDPDAESYNTVPPLVVIESATVERGQIDIRRGLTIEPGQKNIEINFTGINLIKSEQIKFKYKLEGHDPDWVDAGTRRIAYYSYLPPGTYTFRVIAANSDGIWNELGASLNVELKPYFYQTGWFYLLCLAVGILVLFLIWQISVYQLKSRERLLANLVAKRTEELKKANEELQHLANSDGLTAIGNRRQFEIFLAGEWHRAARFKTEISLILLDIDHFKLYNDSYGHQAGDECLKAVAEALRETVKRPTDLVARFGGEEFAIILGGTDAEGAMIIAREAFENVSNLKIAHCKSLTSDYLTISVGVATTFVRLGMNESDLIELADKALYQAKETGRNKIVSNDLSQPFLEVTNIEREYLGLN